MILIIIGRARSGKTQLAKHLANTFVNVRLYDDMTPQDIEEQHLDIEHAAVNIGLAIVILRHAVCADIISRQVAAWQAVLAVSMVQTVDITGL